MTEPKQDQPAKQGTAAQDFEVMCREGHRPIGYHEAYGTDDCPLCELSDALRGLLNCHPNELVPGRVFDKAIAALALAEGVKPHA